MRYIECPCEYINAGVGTSLFLAGGITGCPDWQKEVVDKLCSTDLRVISPRRANWGTTDVSKDPAVIAIADELREVTEERSQVLDTHPRVPHLDMRIKVCSRRLKELTLPVAQIEWEHRHLGRSDGILFWFPKETLCPIALYELGAWAFRPKKLFIGCHPEYARLLDVRIQVGLERIRQTVHTDLDSLVAEVLEWGKAMGVNPLHWADDQIRPDEYNHTGAARE